MGRTESLNLKNDYERACGWYGHFNKSEMALFSECTDRYAQKLLDTADIVREIFRRSRPKHSEIICTVIETDPKEVLRQARQLVKSHEYGAALENYIWFHDHALDADRSFAGVRLSYAISEWVDLGEVYPPARTALEGVRDTKTESLTKGAYDVSLFQDVASINRAFGQVERTSDLFKSIAVADRGVAEKCFHIALESLVRMNEFGLARSFISDPQKEIDHFAMPFKFAPQRTKSASPEIMQETLARIYVKKVNLILQVFIAVGDEDVSNQLRHHAVECVPDEQLRDKIRER